MDIDALASEFGSKKSTPKADASGVDIDALVSEFGSNREEPKVLDKNIKKVYITKPPISGATEEQSNELNARPESAGSTNPRALLPKTNISEAAYEADKAGQATFSSGIEDLGSGHPYKGMGKAALGLFQRLTSPVSGIIEGGVTTPVTDITGNPDIGNRAGIVAGAAIPVDMGLNVANKVAGGLPYLNKLSTYPKNKALSTLVESIEPKNLQTVVSGMKSNPRLGPADLSPKVLQDTQHLFANDGPQINYLAETSANRMAGRPGAVKEAFDASTGLPVNAVQKLKELSEAAKAVGKKEIEPALAKTPHAEVTPIINFIDNEIGKPAMKSIKAGQSPALPLTDYQRELLDVRNKLRGTWPDRDKMFSYSDQVHEIQSKLRTKAETLLGSATGSDKYLGGQLMELRGKLVDSIDKASGGDYKKALSNYRDEKHISETFHDGYSGVFSNSKKMENRPEFTKDWLDGLSKHELEAAKEGARLAIDTEIRAAKNGALAGTNIVKSDFNKEKLELLFGKKEANTLIKKLEDERTIANTHNKIVEGSQTAMRTASKEKFAMPTAGDVGRNMIPAAVIETGNVMAGGIGGLGTAAYLGAKGASAIKDRVSLALAREHNAQYAKLALPTEGPSRNELIRQLEARIPGPKKSILARASSLASRVGP